MSNLTPALFDNSTRYTGELQIVVIYKIDTYEYYSKKDVDNDNLNGLLAFKLLSLDDWRIIVPRGSCIPQPTNDIWISNNSLNTNIAYHMVDRQEFDAQKEFLQNL